MAIALQQPQEGITWEEWSNFGYPRTGHTVCRGSCRCTLAPMMYIEFSAELAEPGGLVVSDVGPTEKQQEIIKLIEQWERAGKDPKALELIGKTENEILEYLRETATPDKTGYLNALRETTSNKDFATSAGAKARADSLQSTISQALKDSGISAKGEAPLVSSLDVMKSGNLIGRYQIGLEKIEIDLDLWERIGEYLKRGQQFSLEELVEIKKGIKTLLHEYVHSLTDLARMGKSVTAINVEEGLTEYIAHNKLNIFIKQLGIDTINKSILDIEIKRAYISQTGSLDSLLQYVSPSKEGRTKLAIEMHRIANRSRRADYYMDTLEKAKGIIITQEQREAFGMWFGNWSGSGYLEAVENIMGATFGL